jgi:MurE/MurF fusion protein
MASSFPPPLLSALLDGIPWRLVVSDPEFAPSAIQVTTISADSRNASAGALFIALSGSGNDGHDYLAAAVAAGCRALLCQQGRVGIAQARRLGVAVVEVADTAVAYGQVAANFFGRPADRLQTIAVTGTNGKTTVSYLLEQLLRESGKSVGVIGTVAVRYHDREGRLRQQPAQLTTPEAFALQQTLREMVDQGVEYLVMEVSSHAIAQARIGGMSFTAAAFTNISRDHLDYHHTMAAYFDSKARLFAEYLRPEGFAVLPELPGGGESAVWLPELHGLTRQQGRRVITWGEGEDADIALVSLTAALAETEITLRTPTGPLPIVTPLLGRYNVDNILCAVALGLGLGLAPAGMAATLARASGAPGRLERVVTPAVGQPVVLVDYAHSPDALEKVLVALRSLPHRRVFTVFGCGGDRDRGKRPLMGNIAARLSDVAIVTDDNPRREDPVAIVAEILPGCQEAGMEARTEEWLAAGTGEGRGYVVIRDRQRAIAAAIRAAGGKRSGADCRQRA